MAARTLLLSLDPSTNCGWCLSEPFTGRPRMRVGSWKLVKGTNFERAYDVAECVGRTIVSEGVERVAIEIPMSAPPSKKKVIRKTALGLEVEEEEARGSLKTQNLLWAIHGGIAGACCAAGVPAHIVGMKEWRKHTLGNGNIYGDESKARCRSLLAKLDIHCEDDHAAEAGGIMFWLNGQRRFFIMEEEMRARQAA